MDGNTSSHTHTPVEHVLGMLASLSIRKAVELHEVYKYIL